MIKAILVIGWRSDSGAYLVDIYPPDYRVDEQDLTNIFSVHRMAANGVFELAKQDFNFIRLFDGTRLVSWYSGFKTTNYLVRPDFCVGLILSEDENPAKWEEPLHVIAYNVLLHLEDPDFIDYLEQLYNGLNEGYLVEPEEGYPGLPYEEEENVVPSDVDRVHSESVVRESDSKSEPDYEAEFDELLSLADEGLGDSSTSAFESSGGGTSSFGASSTSASDPFGGTSSSDPFGGSSAMDPFGGSSTAGSMSSSSFGAPSKPVQTVPQGPDSSSILAQLQELDKKLPPPPTGANVEQQFSYMEKKVMVLEEKLNLLSKLVSTLQLKEAEIREKNDIIAKLLMLLS